MPNLRLILNLFKPHFCPACSLYAELQCWQADESIVHPKSMTFRDVRKLSGGGRNRRRQLTYDSLKHDTDGHRQLQISDSSPFELKCILSDIDVRETTTWYF